ncbi:uncharacterized protein K460DRAFT_409036 [Cucurbitaria berberidis CBS 394.84]|uniref:Uncharacterized protein n=1 Tax=Cucurbitaria berberidis CBS 394.84 TaxID=1168544 RepID=A0A9P4G9N2_9PLEO|nr:uncharacterized protein K460DRAFT_409036 [Cucurbitaria berberidis CBS 394.84]KAF1841576.1 hypothetical protein K460DRAFT_409036 [Cucurbitaria berberidis CBS 394.84]
MDNEAATGQPKSHSKTGVTFRAAHLDVMVDLNNPRPPVSETFYSLRQQVNTTWHELEAAEGHLVALDDTIDAEMLSYVSANQKATMQQVWAERYRITIQKYAPAIDEAEKCCSELTGGIQALEKAAHGESQTLEGQATLEIDIDVMRNCLDTTKNIIEAGRAQLEQARSRPAGT